MPRSFNLKTPIITVVITSAFLSVMYVGFQLYRSMEEAAVGGCISSVRSLLLFALRKPDLQKVIILNSEWRTISEEETGLLFRNIDEPQRFDCYRFPYYKTGKTETGANIKIRVRKVDGYVDLRIEGFPFQ